VDKENFETVCVCFNQQDIPKFVGPHALPSIWMEPYKQAQSTPEEEVIELVSKVTALLFNAVDKRDVSTLNLLHKHHRIDFDTWNGDGMTVLQIASEKGLLEVVEWLIDEAKVGLDVAGLNGFRAIHYAVKRLKFQYILFII